MYNRRRGQRYFDIAQQDPRATKGLVGHWSSIGSGRTWFDLAGNGNNGTLTNGPTWTAGLHSARKAVSFDGTDDYVTTPVGSTNVLNFTSSFAIAFWVKPINTTANTRWIDRSFATSYKIGRSNLGGASTTVDFYLGGTQILGGSYVIGEWMHIVAMFDAPNTAQTLYKNGILIASGTASAPAGNANALRFGASSPSPGNYFKGTLDDIRFYNRPLSDSEIKLLASPSFEPISRKLQIPAFVAAGGGTEESYGYIF